MRNLFLLLILLVVVAIVAIQTGLISITQTRPAAAPTVTASGGKIAARPGQTPAFEVETGTVAIGRETRSVSVPTVAVEPPPTNAPAAAR